MVLDEATSALDSRSEHILWDSWRDMFNVYVYLPNINIVSACNKEIMFSFKHLPPNGSEGMLYINMKMTILHSTEREVQRALEAASRGRTMLVVAHRSSL